MDFEPGDKLVGEVRDAKSGEVLATYQEPAYDTYQVDYLLEDGQSIPNTFTTQLLLPKGCSAEFIQEWLPQRVGGHDFVRMERDGLALRLYYRQTAQTVPPEKPKLEGAVTIIGTPKYNQPLTATVTNLTPAGAKLTYQWYHDDERISWCHQGNVHAHGRGYWQERPCCGFRREVHGRVEVRGGYRGQGGRV